MDFETAKNELLELAQLWLKQTDDDLAIAEQFEIDASICLLKYCAANHETIGDIDFKKLLELDDEAEDYEDNFNARHEFISSVYYKDEEPFTDKNISAEVQQLAAVFYDAIES